MEDSSTNSDIKQTADNKSPKDNGKFPVKVFFILVLTFLLVAGLGYGGYRGYRYFKNLDARVSDLSKQIGETRSYLSGVDDQSRANNERINTINNQLTSGGGTSYAPYEQLYATATVDKVIEDKNAALESGFRFLLVDLKLENKNSTNVYFSVNELKLKDSDSNEFEMYMSSPYKPNYVKNNTNVLFPENRLPTSYASLMPNETVKVTVAFVLNKPSNKFTLYRNGVALRDISL